MKKRKEFLLALILVCLITLAVPPGLYSQGAPSQPAFKAEELEQILAPVALYPDPLLTQMLMASTYPLEIVQADRWVKENKNLKGDALAKALEAQPWDPSVKSLVNFPDVLAMMSQKLDWTQKLGDAFLAQQKDVMGTIQKLRAKAQASGNLKTTKEQVVKVDKEVIVIEPASPQVVYVPTYNPTVVYGAWAYPAYPPYPVYPPGYVATSTAFSFMAGAAVGAAWGYAWGHSDWHGGDVNINYNQNANLNNNINRAKYTSQYQGRGQAGQGSWQHNPQHRGGVAYKNPATAQKYNRAASPGSVQNREAYRGRDGQGQPRASQQPGGAGDRAGTGDRGRQQAGTPGTGDRGRQQAGTPGTGDRGGRPGPSTMESRGGQGPGAGDRGSRPSPSSMESRGGQGAFGGMERGSSARMESSRGQASRSSMSSAQSAQRGGGSGGGGRGGGGGGRGGGGGGRGGGRR